MEHWCYSAVWRRNDHMITSTNVCWPQDDPRSATLNFWCMKCYSQSLPMSSVNNSFVKTVFVTSTGWSFISVMALFEDICDDYELKFNLVSQIVETVCS